jgi:hypothetical protein
LSILIIKQWSHQAMDNPEQPVSPLAKVTNKIKANPIVASMLTLATLLAALSSFTGVAKNLLSLIPENRPAISGSWQGEVNYDWPNAKYKETFVLKDEGDVVLGTATRFEHKQAIFNGKLQGNVLTFVTRTQESISSGPWKDVTHSYRGKIKDNEINFVMQTEGAYTSHLPVEFTMTKIVEPPKD